MKFSNYLLLIERQLIYSNKTIEYFTTIKKKIAKEIEKSNIENKNKVIDGINQWIDTTLYNWFKNYYIPNNKDNSNNDIDNFDKILQHIKEYNDLETEDIKNYPSLKNYDPDNEIYKDYQNKSPKEQESLKKRQQIPQDDEPFYTQFLKGAIKVPKRDHNLYKLNLDLDTTVKKIITKWITIAKKNIISNPLVIPSMDEITKSEAYIKQEKERNKNNKGTKTILELSDGYHWVQLLPQESIEKTRKICKKEGNAMGNCMLSHSSEIHNGIWKVYSLRDSSGEPHCDIAISKKLKMIVELKGNSNKPVQTKYIPYVITFLNTMNKKHTLADKTIEEGIFDSIDEGELEYVKNLACVDNEYFISSFIDDSIYTTLLKLGNNAKDISDDYHKEYPYILKNFDFISFNGIKKVNLPNYDILVKSIKSKLQHTKKIETSQEYNFEDSNTTTVCVFVKDEPVGYIGCVSDTITTINIINKGFGGYTELLQYTFKKYDMKHIKLYTDEYKNWVNLFQYYHIITFNNKYLLLNRISCMDEMSDEYFKFIIDNTNHKLIHTFNKLQLIEIEQIVEHLINYGYKDDGTFSYTGYLDDTIGIENAYNNKLPDKTYMVMKGKKIISIFSFSETKKEIQTLRIYDDDYIETVMGEIGDYLKK